MKYLTAEGMQFICQIMKTDVVAKTLFKEIAFGIVKKVIMVWFKLTAGVIKIRVMKINRDETYTSNFYKFDWINFLIK